MKLLPLFFCALLLSSSTAASSVTQETTVRQTASLPPAWQSVFDALTLYGDFRFRQEGDRNRPAAEDRQRSRVRLRLGANYSVSDELLVGGRITTGNPDDPRDTNATLGGGLGKFELNLDRLFLTWSPESVDPFYLTVGKFAHPFTRNPVYEELVWYSDVQPEGVALGQRWRNLGPFDAVGARAGMYVLLEDTKGDVNLGVAELSADSKLSPNSRAALSAAWYGYSNPDVLSAATVKDYQILDVIGALTIDTDRAPWKFSAEGIANLAASTSQDTGWALGLSYGQTRKQGDWRVYYQYQEIGNDAVFVPVAGADFLIDHNFRGHVFNVDHLLTDKSTLRLRVLSATPIEPSLIGGFDDTTLRVRLEFSVKF